MCADSGMDACVFLSSFDICRVCVRIPTQMANIWNSWTGGPFKNGAQNLLNEPYYCKMQRNEIKCTV